MSPENTRRLFERYPILYSQRTMGMHATAMCWGFECGDGWFEIVDDLSKKLESMNMRIRNEAMAKRGPVARFAMWAFSFVSDTPLDIACSRLEAKSLVWGDGWRPRWYRRFWRAANRLARPFPKPCYIEASQVKEKVGSLRFYTNVADDEADSYISDAERLSEKTCEECGGPGKIRGGGWLMCLCDGCDAAHKEAKEKLLG